MLVVVGSTVAFLASLVAYTKPRRYWSVAANKIMMQIKFNLLGAYANILDIVYSRYNKIDLPCKTGCVAIVTGGSRGIGETIVKMFLQCDMHVIIACRRIEAGEKVFEKIRKSGIATGNASVYHLDNTSLESVKKFAGEIHGKFNKIDVLVNNAGVMFPPYEETVDGFEQQWVINYLSHFLLTAMLMPQLRNAGSARHCSRVVNVSSCAHVLGKINFEDINYKSTYDTHSAYAQSKLAQVMFTKSLDEIAKQNNLPIRSYSVHPGLVDTALFDHVPMGKWRWFKRLFFKTPEQGATGIVYAAVSPQIEEKGGIYLSNCLETSVVSIANDKTIQEKLFALSLQQTKLENFLQYL